MKEDIMQIVKLLIITIISAAVLAFVFGITKEPIEKSKAEETLKAVKSVVNGYKNTMIIEDTILNFDNQEFTAYNVHENDNIIGRSIISSSNNGYGGTIKIMVGVNDKFEITGIYVLEHAETPGLGSKMNTPEFKNQFLGKSLEKYKFSVTKDGGDVDAITSATITSRAVTEAIELGIKVLEENYKIIEETIDTINENEKEQEVDDVN